MNGINVLFPINFLKNNALIAITTLVDKEAENSMTKLSFKSIILLNLR